MADLDIDFDRSVLIENLMAAVKHGRFIAESLIMLRGMKEMREHVEYFNEVLEQAESIRAERNW